MDILSDYSVLISIGLILVLARVFLPGILKPLRPKSQSTTTLNTLGRIKGEDIQDMTQEQWSRVQWLITEEQKVIAVRANANANNWMAKAFGGSNQE